MFNPLMSCDHGKCVLVSAGKSAGMIMRQINADALAEAKTLHLEQTCDLLQACHLTTEADSLHQNPVHHSGSVGHQHQVNSR